MIFGVLTFVSPIGMRANCEDSWAKYKRSEQYSISEDATHIMVAHLYALSGATINKKQISQLVIAVRD